MDIETKCVIVCVGLAGGVISPTERDAPTGAYLKSYNPEAFDGQGFAEWTHEPKDAKVFSNLTEAHACWTQVPNSRPLRPDGKPNRPLTAFSVQITLLDEETP